MFDAAVIGTRSAHPLAIPANAQFTIERWQQTVPANYFPAVGDGSLEGYQERIAGLLPGRKYALVIHLFHTFHYPQWARERAFYAGLWNYVGQPLSGAITTMFHGTYEHSPVGVHKDRLPPSCTCCAAARGCGSGRGGPGRSPFRRSSTTLGTWTARSP